MTAGGIFGTITYLEDGVAHLEVDTDVVIRVTVVLDDARGIGSRAASRAARRPPAKASNGSTAPKSDAAADDEDDADQTESQ